MQKRHPHNRRPRETVNERLISGRNPVLEALRSAMSIKRIWMRTEARGQVMQQIKQLARRRNIHFEEVDNAVLDRLLKHTDHRGVAMELEERPAQSLADFLRDHKSPKELLLLALDGIQDPQNLGAILRSADICGVDALLMQATASAPLGEVAWRASAGAAAWVPVIQVEELAESLAFLRSQGVTTAGLDEDRGDTPESGHVSRPLALVLGGEGRGLADRVQSELDHYLRLPMRGHVGSFNASVAAGIVMYHFARRQETK